MYLPNTDYLTDPIPLSKCHRCGTFYINLIWQRFDQKGIQLENFTANYSRQRFNLKKKGGAWQIYFVLAIYIYMYIPDIIIYI